MNSNLAKVGTTRWPPGQSGNPAGKPPGTRTAFSQGFIRDFALVCWAEEGLEAVRKVAKKRLPLGSQLRYNPKMKKSIRVKPKKRGRPATGKDPLVGARLPPALIDQLDAWASRGSIGRSEAMRRLLERALASESQLGTAEGQKASTLADRAAERLVDKSLPVEEQQRRKRALIKGPKEFREIREDLPKDKTKGAD